MNAVAAAIAKHNLTATQALILYAVSCAVEGRVPANNFHVRTITGIRKFKTVADAIAVLAEKGLLVKVGADFVTDFGTESVTEMGRSGGPFNARALSPSNEGGVSNDTQPPNAVAKSPVGDCAAESVLMDEEAMTVSVGQPSEGQHRICGVADRKYRRKLLGKYVAAWNQWVEGVMSARREKGDLEVNEDVVAELRVHADFIFIRGNSIDPTAQWIGDCWANPKGKKARLRLLKQAKKEAA